MNILAATPRALFLALALTVLSVSLAGAQISEPGVSGGGSVLQAPGGEPSTSSGSWSLDQFLLDRATRMVMAAVRWQPSASVRAVSAPLAGRTHLAARAGR